MLDKVARINAPIRIKKSANSGRNGKPWRHRNTNGTHLRKICTLPAEEIPHFGAAIGLAGTEYTILISIAHLGQDAPVNVKTIAEHLHVTTGFITNTTRKLQSRGLVRKTQDTTDKRKTNLTVTPKAIALLEELAPFQRPVNDAEFGSLSRAEFLQLSETIQRLVASSEDAARLQQDLENGEIDT